MTGIGDEKTDRGLWGFAVQLYGERGVREACLDLQDRLGLDVDLLLFAVWSAAAGPGQLDATSFKECIDLTAAWQRRLVRPLRSLRRAAGNPIEPVPAGSVRAIADQLKALELEAERIELAMLESWAGQYDGKAPAAEPAAAAASNLVAYLAAAGVDTQSAAASIRVLLAAAFNPSGSA